MKVLLIVDIQKSMGNWFSWSYINKVHKFLNRNTKKYDKIILLMEPDISLADYKLCNLDKADHKRIAEIIDALQPDEVPSFLLDFITEPPIYKMYNSYLYNRMLELRILPKSDFVDLSTQSIKGYYRMYLSPDLKQLVADLKSATQVDLIGGGVSKCVSLTENLLTYHNIPATILTSICYDIRFVNTNRRPKNVFKTTPIKSLHPSLLNEDKTFKLTKVDLED